MRLRPGNPVHLLALGLGTGLSPHAPGTVGTLAGVALYLLLENLSIPVYVSIWVVLALLGIAICGKAARDMKVNDDPSIVFDEVVGYLITMTAAPEGWQWVVAGFVTFRVFDIWKPWPIRVLDARMHGGAGIMADDVLAGVFAWAALQALVMLSQ